MGRYATFRVHILPLVAQEEGLTDYNLHVIEGLRVSLFSRNRTHIKLLICRQTWSNPAASVVLPHLLVPVRVRHCLIASVIFKAPVPEDRLKSVSSWAVRVIAVGKFDRASVCECGHPCAEDPWV